MECNGIIRVRFCRFRPFSSPEEAAIPLVCARNRDLWPLPISEFAQCTRSVFFSQSDLSYLTRVRESLISGFGGGQRSRFLAQTRRIVGSADENGFRQRRSIFTHARALGQSSIHATFYVYSRGEEL